MKIVSWNVNGLRAGIKKDLVEFVKSQDADIFNMQEIKITAEDLEKLQEDFLTQINTPYFMLSNCATRRKGYSGTLTLTKTKPLNVTCGINNNKFDIEGRVLTLEFPDYYIVDSYFPHTGRGLERLNFKLEFNEAIETYLGKLKKPVIISGDFNVAHMPIDIARPKENEKNAGFTQEERESFSKLLGKNYTDTFRYMNPNMVKYTWWSQISSARERNVGWRFDYNLISSALQNKIVSAEILDKVLGSDHCPILLTADI